MKDWMYVVFLTVAAEAFIFCIFGLVMALTHGGHWAP